MLKFFLHRARSDVEPRYVVNPELIDIEIKPDSEGGKEGRKFGLEIVKVCADGLPGYLVIAVADDGLLHEWNTANPASAVLTGDAIRSINGKTSFDDMLQELESSQTISVKMMKGDEKWRGKPVHREVFGGQCSEEDNTTIWQGEPSSMLGEEGQKPWLNIHVLWLWDRSRLVMQLASLLFIVLDLHFGSEEESSNSNDMGVDVLSGQFGLQLASAEAFILSVMSMIGQFAILIDAFFLLLQLRALKEATYPLVYRILAKLHSQFHGGKPPFVPVDTRGGLSQQALLCLCLIFMTIFNRILSIGFVTSRGDRSVLNAYPIIWITGYLALPSNCFMCQMRGAIPCYATTGAYHLIQEWNGIKVLQVAFSHSGPAMTYNKNRCLVPSYHMEFKNPPASSRVGRLAAVGMAWWLPSPLWAMLLCWHTSTVCYITIPFALAGFALMSVLVFPSFANLEKSWVQGLPSQEETAEGTV